MTLMENRVHLFAIAAAAGVFACAHAHDYDHPTADYGGRSLICGLGAANTSYTGFCRVQQQADQTLEVTSYDAYGNVRTDPSSTFVVTPQ